MAMTIKPGHVERIISPQYIVDLLIDALERNNFIVERWNVEKTSNGINAYVIAQIPPILLSESMQKAIDELTRAGIFSTLNYQYNGQTEVEIKINCFPRQQETYEHHTMDMRRISITREALINDDMGVFANSWNGFFTPIPPASLEILRKTQHPDWYDEKEERDDGVI